MLIFKGERHIFMKNINQKIKYLASGILTLAFVFGFTFLSPSRAEAFEWGRLIDPLCLFACKGDPDVGQFVDPACIWACDDYVNTDYHYVAPPQNPTVSITANPTIVSYNNISTISWNSNHATFCVGSGGGNEWAGHKSTSGSFYTGALTSSTVFYITCSNTVGSSVGSVIINVTPQPISQPEVTISANPTNVDYNGSSTISWNSNHATSCTASGGANGWAGAKNTSGTFNTGALTNNTTFYITCNNSTGSSIGSVTISVANQQINNPTVNISANPNSINHNNSSTISWSSNHATSCNASGGASGWAGSKSTSGTFNTGALTNTTTFNIVCTNAHSSANDSTTVHVNSAQVYNNNYNYNDYNGYAYYTAYNNPQPQSNYIYSQPYYNYTYPQTSVTLSADRMYLNYGESTIVRWYPNNATSCNATGGSNGWNGTQTPFSGTFNTGPLFYTTTYTISCNNYNNSYDTRSITITVGNQTQTQQSNSSLVATTTGATQISNTSARLNSTISNPGNNGSVNSWFEWGRTINLGNKTSATPVGTLQSTTHADNISGLSPGTTYYFRAVAENSLWRNNGSILSFTTGGQNTVIIQEPVIVNNTKAKTPLTALVLMAPAINRNQPIAPTIDNTRPHPGDEINYTLNYQHIGTGSITNITLRVDLPQDVSYLFATPSNPTVFGNTVIFNLGTLPANGQNLITIKTKVSPDAEAGTSLNFPATLIYVDPAGKTQSVNANTSAKVWATPTDANTQDEGGSSLEANAFGSGFLPTNLFGWLLLIVLILALILIGKHLFFTSRSLASSHEDGQAEHH